MSKRYMLFVGIFSILIVHSYVSYDKPKKEAHEIIFHDDYPSYQCKNKFGQFDHCLRAAKDLPAGVVVGSPDFAKTDNEFIALHKSKEFRHVAIMGLKKDGSIQWGRVYGKMALVNHSCDPNCELTDDGCVVTIKEVKKAEELTIAYDVPLIGIDWNPKWNFECLCFTEKCRKKINSYNNNRKPRKLKVV